MVSWRSLERRRKLKGQDDIAEAERGSPVGDLLGGLGGLLGALGGACVTSWAVFGAFSAFWGRFYVMRTYRRAAWSTTIVVSPDRFHALLQAKSARI